MGRHGGYPLRKKMRPRRERTAVYKSLDENDLGLEAYKIAALVDAANVQRDRELREVLRHGGGRYPTRSRSKFIDEEFLFPPTDEDSADEPVKKRKEKRRVNIFDENDDDSTRDVPEKAETSIRRTRHAILDSEEDEERSGPVCDESNVSMYERVKSRRQNSTVPPSPPEKQGSPQQPTTSSRSTRLENRHRKNSEANNDTNDEEEAVQDEEEDVEPRQYPLRRERKTVQRYGDVIISQRKNPERKLHRMTRMAERIERQSRRRARREYKRRLVRSDSSSTESDDSEAGGSKGRRGVERDEERFASRKEKSMAKARNRFLPINLSEKDLGQTFLIREKLRQTGASCSDIDPMNIDKSVLFDQVGGLGPHIQTLKETVLFPLLYPEMFTQFDISPPKGVVFYGPPGTGKTLVARALANECSRGAKKVAFFMRKGADCLSKWVGESERQLRLLFDQAYSMRPSIIFFDEIDGLAPVRSSRQDQIHSSIVSTLLALMDGLDSRGEVVVIGATNRLDTLDPALRRPGRFDRELKFSLPDAAARRQILQIHTSKWGTSRPSAETLDWLADSTSGYCGADLKFLCTEAVLIALRARYPHMYMSNEKLKLDPASIQVSRENLSDAMRRITPASRRDLSIPSRPLDARTSILLSPTLNTLLSTRIPAGYRHSLSIQNVSSSELEKVVRALESPPVVPAVRLLLTGSSECVDGGQSSFLLPALLSRLDHLPIFSVAIGKLFADGRPEEALAQTMQSAIRAANTTPAILLLPNADQWHEVMPPSVCHMLYVALENLTGFTSLMVLATCDGIWKDGPIGLKQLFRQANTFQVTFPTQQQRKAYFEYVVAPAIQPPKTFDASLYPCPPVATAADVPSRKLDEKELRELKKTHSGQLRQFRIFLRDTLGRLMRDRRFHIFNNPVDVEDAADYYEIIQEPMCMTDMMAKIDRREYSHPDEFLADITLIMRNALEYNPDRNQEDKMIRHAAVGLRDMADALFDMELDEKFIESMTESGRLLQEAGEKVENEQLPFVNLLPHNRPPPVKREDDKEEEETTPLTTPRTPSHLATSIKRKRKPGTYDFPKKKKKHAKRMALENGVGEDEHHEASSANHDEDVEEEEEEDLPNEDTVDSPPNNILLIDKKELEHFVEKAVSVTSRMAIPELERLSAELSHCIECCRDIWDRRDLPSRLTRIVNEWNTR